MTVASGSSLNQEFLHLVALAASVLDEHTSDDSTHTICAVCGERWPCEPVTTAEHNLALF